jgi:hypothetical protein
LGSYLDQVEVCFPGDVKSFGERLYAELRPVGIDEAHLTSTDSIVDSGLAGGRCCGDWASLLVVVPEPAPLRDDGGRRKATPAILAVIRPVAHVVAGWGREPRFPFSCPG